MKILNFLLDILALRRSDILLVSFPKSGNTRFRMAVARYIYLQTQKTNDEFSFQYVNDLLPELGKGTLWKLRLSNKNRFDSFPLIVKSHMSNKLLWFLVYRTNVVYVYRKDPSTLMSYYDYAQSRNIVSRMSFSEFLQADRHGLRSFVDHIKFFERYVKITIDYYDLVSNKDIDVICKCLEQLGVQFHYGIMERAIVETRKSEVASLKNNLDDSSYNFAGEKSRSLADYFSQSDFEHYEKLVHENGLHNIRNNRND